MSQLALGEQLPWIISRSSGLAALLALLALVGLGVASASGLFIRIGRPRWKKTAMGWHRPLAWAAGAMVVLHILVLKADSFVKVSWGQLLLPFNYPQKTLWVGLGALALVLAAVVMSSFYLRRRFGGRWKNVHRLGSLALLLALVHALGAGTDLSSPVAQRSLIGLGLTVACLVAYRALNGRRSTKPSVQRRVAEPLSQGAAPASAGLAGQRRFERGRMSGQYAHLFGAGDGGVEQVAGGQQRGALGQ